MVQTLTLTLTLTLTPQGGAARRGGVQPGLRAGRPARYNLARPLCPTLTLTLMPNQPALCVSIPTPTPRSGKLHFKNKFCDNCRSCIMVPVLHPPHPASYPILHPPYASWCPSYTHPIISRGQGVVARRRSQSVVRARDSPTSS